MVAEMRTRHSSPAVIGGLFLIAFLTGCGQADRIYPAALADGTYRVVYGKGYLPADEALVLAVTARLDRATNRLVLTMANGARQTLTVSFRPRDQWQPDCYTMASHSLNEVADLSPAPLQLESLTFATPVVYAKCAHSG